MRRTTLHRSSKRMLALVGVVSLAVVGLDRPDALAAPAAEPAQTRTGPTVSGNAVEPSARGMVAAPVTVPGNLTGLGFDACRAPSQAAMDAMRQTTPYWGVGVYIGGESRTCPQPNLTRSWVRTQHGKGWHIVAIWAGLQAPKVDGASCSDRGFPHRMSARNGTAASQGVSAANRAVANARELGIAKGSTLFLDLESYRNDDSACNQPVQHFQSGWTSRLHHLGWKSGYYSSLKTGIYALDYVRTQFPGTYEMPDAVWFSAANNKANLEGSPYLAPKHWATQRMHQYKVDLSRRYAGQQVTLDENILAIGRGSRAGTARGTCGVDLDFTRYHVARRGDRSGQVTAVQCLLRRHGLYSGALDGRLDRPTGRAVATWNARVGLRKDATVRASTWTTLLASGTQPLVKRGSAGDRVRFLQRALTAASSRTVTINGVFSGGTTEAVKRYQGAMGLTRTGVVDRATWSALQHGRR